MAISQKIALAFLSTTCACASWIDDLPPQIHTKQLSEAYGYYIGRAVCNSRTPLDVDALIQGIQDSVAEYRGNSKRVYSALDLADAFILSNAKRKDVVQVTPHLQYVVLCRGEGAEVGPQSVPQLNYSGYFMDGTPFTKEYEVADLMRAVVGMREGEKRQLFVHPGIKEQSISTPLLLLEIEAIKVDRETLRMEHFQEQEGFPSGRLLLEKIS